MSKDIPVLFLGHGSPMIALEDNKLTNNFKKIGKIIMDEYKPKAVLSISAHWFKLSNKIQSAENPKQIYDFSGFPKELSEVKYEPKGSSDLTDKVVDILKDEVEIDDSWGIDHGTWTVLKHLFPSAKLPVVQLSVNRAYTFEEMYKLGKRLISLRKDFLVIGSGNIVHNLYKTDLSVNGGSDQTKSFDSYIEELIKNQDYENLSKIKNHPDYKYAVNYRDHFSPLAYILGLSNKDKALIFNKAYDLSSISMTSYAFGLDFDQI
ncbi:MAG: class III extradiol ring-cleavage dioxygenase [Finegoldia sp.]|nr:class III extradiol ring-cleavage dioxygenase [Finegoldia sp.]